MPADLTDLGWERLRVVEHVAADAVPKDVAALCERHVVGLLRVASVQDSELEGWRQSDQFTASERAHLAFVEQFVIDVTGVSDDLVTDLATHVGPEQVYHFVRWLQLVEARHRAALMLRHHSTRRFV